MSETSAQETKKKIRLTYIISAIAISCLMIGASMGIMISATTPSIPTVIEPGSSVRGTDYIIFKSGSISYSVNGTTGAVTSYATDAIAIQTVINSTKGGSIEIAPGHYDISNLVVGQTGTKLTGQSTATVFMDFEIGTWEYTELHGNVSVQASNCQLKDLTIKGKLILEAGDGSPPDRVAQYCDYWNLWITDGVKIIGRDDASDGDVPFYNNFYGGGISRSTAGPCIEFQNGGNPICGIRFFSVYVDQYSVNGDVISIHGRFAVIQFVECVFATERTGSTFINITAPSHGGLGLRELTFDSCHFNCGDTGVVFIYIPQAVYGAEIEIQFNGGQIYQCQWLIVDLMDGGRYKHSIRFSNVDMYAWTAFRFKQAWPTPQTAIYFTQCWFGYNAAITSTTSGSTAIYTNCQNFNPIGKIASPFTSGNKIAIKGSSVAATPTNNTNYTVNDVPMLIDVSGGAGVDMVIYDPDGNIVASGLSTLTREYVPIDWTIHFIYTSVPTVAVYGI